MSTIKRISQIVAIASITLATLSITAGATFAASGSVGRHYDPGVRCEINAMKVNEPKVLAFDATTAIDSQTVYWLAEIWKLNEVTGQYEFVTDNGAWTASVVEDGTGWDYMTLGGGQSFDIFQSGIYRSAIRYYWEPTANAAAGEAYEWVESYYLVGWSWVLGTDVVTAGACLF